VTHRVALLPGDGVGPEVIAEARRAVDALELDVEWTELPWGSAYWHEHGRMMPEDWEAVVRGQDAVLMGAVGDPSVPDHVSLWGLILLLRQRLDLWANLRPVRLLEGIPCPLAGRGPADVDMLFVRENSEGEYSGVGGRAHTGLPSEVGIETSVFTRAGVERVIRHAFELASGRRGLVTSATKSNASRFGYVLWDEVVVASNLFADILTDLAAAIQGGMGMAASANLAPGTDAPGLFEPVHGSAPDIAGQGVGNPAGAIWSASLLLEHLGEQAAGAALMSALEEVCRDGPRTRDVGGDATTREVGEAVAARAAALSARSR
jgi:tartrate dehydrogenase/decarboxylase/D-malate dehydrogenase